MRIRIATLWLLLPATFLPADPAWWTTRGVKSTDPASNLAPATIGQAKHLAAMSLAELEGKLPPSAFQSLQTDLAAIVDLTLPDPLPSDFYERQRAVLLSGQLKAIAKPFYEHLRAHDPAWLDNAMQQAQLVVMEPGTSTPSPYPWTEAATDDSNMAVATLGQLKAVFSLPLEFFALDTDEDGIPDYWEIQSFGDLDETAEGDADADGLSNLEENQLDLDPNSFDQIGPVNLSFDEEISDSPDLSFRPEYPSDLFGHDSIPGWQAAEGLHIEIWDETKGPPAPEPEPYPSSYVELQSHWDGKGIEQKFDMLPSTTETFLLAYKGRYDNFDDSNPFTMKVEGAHEVLVDGQPLSTMQNAKQKSFMTDDDIVTETYAEWQYAAVTITANPEATTLVPVTLTLIPDNTDHSITHGGFVDIVPVDITVIFGEGPGGFTAGVGMTSKQNLENYLETVKVANIGNIWCVKGKDDRLFGLEIGKDEVALLSALSTHDQTVVFDGHANFGIGPNFSKATNKTIDSFSNFGTGSTDIPVEYRGDGTMQDVLPYYPSSPPPELTMEEQGEILSALGHMAEEGWVFLVVDAADVKEIVANNPVSHMEGRWKYEKDHAVSAGDQLNKQGAGLAEYHFITESLSKRVIISAPKDDLPALRYKTFFYNACSTGPHFIENFDHGEFIYTNRRCFVFKATELFVKGIIEEKMTEEILGILEAEVADGPENKDVITYEVKNF